MEENLRDQLIEKTKNLDLKKRLLETKNISLEQTLDKARAWETATSQAKDMSSLSKPRDGGVKAVKMSGDGKRKLICYNCEKEGHIKRDKSCPARGRKCAKCKKTGHFAACCNREKAAEREENKNRDPRGIYRGHWGHGDRQKRGSTNQVEYSSDSSENHFAFSVSEEKTQVHAVSDEPIVPVGINGIVKEVLIDSGSVSNLINIKEYEELKSQGLNASLTKCSKRLFAYGGRQLSVQGQFEAELSYNNKKFQSVFVVTDKGRCLLGHVASKELGILQIGASIETVCNNTSDVDIGAELQAKYPKVFTGIGKLVDYQLKLHIDESTTPVAQKPRRTPFALREKVSAKVEKVEGPTSWVSPIVVAPKPSGDIHLCVDMRCANKAIIRERIPMPTIDEVLENLNGSCMFSKLDLRLGLHQVELEEVSRDTLRHLLLMMDCFVIKDLCLVSTLQPKNTNKLSGKLYQGSTGSTILKTTL